MRVSWSVVAGVGVLVVVLVGLRRVRYAERKARLGIVVRRSGCLIVRRGVRWGVRLVV